MYGLSVPILREDIAIDQLCSGPNEIPRIGGLFRLDSVQPATVSTRPSE